MKVSEAKRNEDNSAETQEKCKKNAINVIKPKKNAINVITKVDTSEKTVSRMAKIADYFQNPKNFPV
ncbi:Hypothetical predicted protein, partial [Paramuricea clavata]